MNKAAVFFLILLGGLGLAAAEVPDFIVPDIIVPPDGFIHIVLRNGSPHGCAVTPQLKEKIFLTLYINNVKRAEYKLKYIDAKLFKPRGTVRFRTNFRLPGGAALKVKTHVNPLRIIEESNHGNNVREKQLKGK